MPTAAHTRRAALSGRCRRVLEPLAAHGAVSGAPSLPEVRAFLQAADTCFARLAQAVRADEGVRATLRAVALWNTLPAFLSIRAGSVPASLAALMEAWASAVDVLRVPGPRPRVRLRTRVPAPPDLGVVLAFETGVTEFVRGIASGASAAATVRRLMTHLQVSYDDVGRMVGVSGETVRRWEQGITGVPAEKRGLLAAADAALSRLLAMFKAEALPAVVRRPAEVFQRERALDWILRGRIGDVVEQYDLALSYQA